MRARGRGMTWWARTAQKSGSRLLPNAAVPVWLSSALKAKRAPPFANQNCIQFSSGGVGDASAALEPRNGCIAGSARPEARH